MYFNIYSNVSAAALRDQLGGWSYGNPIDAFPDLISVLMILCNRITELESRIDLLKGINETEC